LNNSSTFAGSRPASFGLSAIRWDAIITATPVGGFRQTYHESVAGLQV
jgi:hypothetical protein